MPQATRRWISEKVKSLNESNVLPFHDILDAKMVNAALASAGVTFKERIHTPFVTLCMFLSQVLDPDNSCRAAVARLIVWLAVNHRKPCSPETNSYCDARQRLPLEVIVELVHQTARKIEADASDKWLWKGRPTSLIDGSTSSMPDTPENQRAFPQANTQGKGLGFPLVRYVALISLATGLVRDLALVCAMSDNCRWHKSLVLSNLSPFCEFRLELGLWIKIPVKQVTFSQSAF